ncbi:lycopene cyclase domain-containing protein [Mucilaginibacter sp.]
MKFTYLLIDLFSVLVPFIFSFHPRLKFYKHWPALFPAMIISAIFFIVWDIYFTYLKIWGFNPDYLTGIHIGNLPIEEILFFLCIPYSCVFTYACLDVIIKTKTSKQSQLIISSLLLAVSVFMVIKFHTNHYTASTFALLIVLLIIIQYILKADWLYRFYITYLFLLLPFLIVNGLLTGTGLKTPVVWYNHADIINLRILTIPFEDIFYGMDLILLNVTIYSLLSAKYNKETETSGGHMFFQNNNLF